jgi:ferrous iron transport protein B
MLSLALAGNPNAGKTTLFNALTGARQRVGNYPGVTVERKEGTASLNGASVSVLDLPGTYSLTAYTDEELVARDVLVDVLDATVLERSLYLAVQLMELGVPLVLALNMVDELPGRHMRVDAGRLAKLLGVPVVETVGRAGRGVDDLLREAAAYSAKRGKEFRPLEVNYGPDVEPVVLEMTRRIQADGFLTSRFPARWTALKYVEGDEQVMARGLAANPRIHEALAAQVRELAAHLQATMGVDPESVVADQRYGFIASVLKQGVLTRDDMAERLQTSEHVDRVVTHALVGPLLMLAILYGMFWTTFTLGEYPTGWLEAAFGWLSATVEAAMPDGLLRSLVVSGIIDGAGGVLGFVPLITIMFAMITFLEDLGYVARMAYMLDRFFRIFGLHGCSVMPFIVSGGIAGGCAVPGIMAARTLKSPQEKLATVLASTFMTCGAKIPVFAMLVAAFFAEHQAEVMFGITMFAWAMALGVSWLLRNTIIRGRPTPFVMELPPYRLPTLRGVAIHTWDRAWSYIRKAGTTILAVSILLWAAMTFPQLPETQVEMFENMRQTAQAELAGENLETRMATVDAAEAEAALEYSVAGRLGRVFEPVSQLAGFDWRTNIALLGGVAAKEIIVATLGTAYSLGEVDTEDTAPLSERLAADPQWSPVTALALIVFVLLYSPCFVTVVTMAKETSWRWALFATTFNTALAFALAVAVYRIGGALLG